MRQGTRERDGGGDVEAGRREAMMGMIAVAEDNGREEGGGDVEGR